MPIRFPVCPRLYPKKKPRVRQNVVWALGKIKDPLAVDMLLEAIVYKKNIRQIKHNAIWVLGEIGSLKPVPTLIPLLGDRIWGRPPTGRSKPSPVRITVLVSLIQWRSGSSCMTPGKKRKCFIRLCDSRIYYSDLYFSLKRVSPSSGF